MNPFLIEGPAVISFSGGRTSGLMLYRILGAHGWMLPDDVYVLFANTGKERPETLDFVHAVAAHWKVRVRWLERERGEGERASFREVDHATASRDGAPFEALITERKFLPNPVTRYCTQELKIRVMREFMLAQGIDHWTNVVGLRADEPGRVAKQRAGEGKDRWDLSFPLFTAGVTRNDVVLFWKKQPFDLQLRSWEGNCDLCFLKGVEKRKRILQDRPDLAAWWVEREQAVGATFRNDAPSYGALLRTTESQLRMFDNALFPDPDHEDPTDLGDCTCLEAA